MDLTELNEIARKRLANLAHAIGAHNASGRRDPQTHRRALRASLACDGTTNSIGECLDQFHHFKEAYPHLLNGMLFMRRQAWQQQLLNDGVLTLLTLPLLVRCPELPVDDPAVTRAHGPTLETISEILRDKLQARRVVFDPAFRPEWVLDQSRCGRRAAYMRHLALGGQLNPGWQGWRVRQAVGKNQGGRWQCLWLLGVVHSENALCDLAGNWSAPIQPSREAIQALVLHPSMWPSGGCARVEVESTGWGLPDKVLPDAGHEHRCRDFLMLLQRMSVSSDAEIWLEDSDVEVHARLIARWRGRCVLVRGLRACLGEEPHPARSALAVALTRAFGPAHRVRVGMLNDAEFSARMQVLRPEEVDWRLLPP